jgi:methionyl-tRNA formyltransferase
MIHEKKRMWIACGEATAIEPIEVQLEGKKRMSAEAFLNGQHLQDNEKLGVKVA